MALFGKADRNDVSLLSQYYQLDVDIDVLSKTEIDAWGLHCLKEGLLISKTDVAFAGRDAEANWQYLQKHWEKLQYLSQVLLEGKAEAILKPLARMHLPMIGVMNVITRRDEASEEDKRNFQYRVSLLDTHLQRTPRGVSLVEMEPFGIVLKQSEVFFLQEALLQEFVASARHPLNTRGGFTWCSECDSVFVAKKREQLFCSHRCGDRRSKRDRNARNKMY